MRESITSHDSTSSDLSHSSTKAPSPPNNCWPSTEKGQPPSAGTAALSLRTTSNMHSKEPESATTRGQPQKRKTGPCRTNGTCRSTSRRSLEYPPRSRTTSTWKALGRLSGPPSELTDTPSKTVRPSNAWSTRGWFPLWKRICLKWHLTSILLIFCGGEL